MAKRIILVSIDSLRFDAIACEQDTRYLRRYGLDDVRRTPVLDGLASEGVRVRQAIAAAPYTTSSHTSMLTGYYPPRHGVRAFLSQELPRTIKTLTERLRGHGYRTIASIDLVDLFRLVGLTRGFEEIVRYDDDALFALIERHRAEPMFLFCHFEDVHYPYGESPCPPSGGDNDDVYDTVQRLARELGLAPTRRPGMSRADLARLDLEIKRDCWVRDIADAVQFPLYLQGVNKFDGGRFRLFVDRLRDLGMLEDSLLIVTGDHGEGPVPARKRPDRWIPMKFGHGEPVAEELIRVPLIIRAPRRLEAGRVVDAQVSLVDLTPTILDYVGLRSPADADGVSIRGLLEGREETVRQDAYTEGWYQDDEQLLVALNETGAVGGGGAGTFLFQASLRTPQCKYVETGSDLTAEELALPDAEFVRVLVRRLQARAHDAAFEGALLSALAGGASREAVAADVQDHHAHRRALYDLDADPFEQVNMLAVDIGRRASGGEPRYASAAAAFARRLREVQRRAEEVPAVVDRESGPNRLRIGLDLALAADVRPAAAGQLEPEVQARTALARVAAVGSIGDLEAMRTDLVDVLRAHPEAVRDPAARLDIAQIAHRLVMASTSPVAATRALCVDMTRAAGQLTAADRTYLKQTLTKIWMELAIPLSFGWDCRADPRAAARAAARAIAYEPTKIWQPKRRVLVLVLARGLVGPRLADAMRALIKRARPASERGGMRQPAGYGGGPATDAGPEARVSEDRAALLSQRAGGPAPAGTSRGPGPSEDTAST